MLSLETSRLRLVPLGPEHADAMFAGLSDIRLYEFLDETPPKDVQSLRARYDRWSRRRSPDDTEDWLNWVVLSESDQRCLGYVQATVLPTRIAEIGYVIFREAWGHGFAREAVGSMLPHLRDVYHAVSFRAVVEPRNARSIRLLQSLNFADTPRHSGAEWTRSAVDTEPAPNLQRWPEASAPGGTSASFTSAPGSTSRIA